MVISDDNDEGYLRGLLCGCDVMYSTYSDAIIITIHDTVHFIIQVLKLFNVQVCGSL